MLGNYVGGMPRIGSRVNVSHRIVFRGQPEWYLPGGRIISGACSRDPGNTDVTILRPGLLMGKITTVVNSLGTVGLYAPSVLGATTGAYTSGGTTLNVSAAVAAEIVRRVGSSGTGTLKALGPPTAAGTVVATAITYSAVNTSTGDITVTSLGVNKVSGTLITPADGSEDMLTLIPDGWGERVVDSLDNTTSQDQPFPYFPIGGVIYAAQIVNWPADTAIRQWIADKLSRTSGGKFMFDYTY